MVDSEFIVVKMKLCHRNLLFFLLNHFPDEEPMVEVALHLFIEGVHHQLLVSVAMVALEAEVIHKNDRVDVAAVEKIISIQDRATEAQESMKFTFTYFLKLLLE